MPEPSPLGAFLRSRRELRTPAEVGLRPSPHRHLGSMVAATAQTEMCPKGHLDCPE